MSSSSEEQRLHYGSAAAAAPASLDSSNNSVHPSDLNISEQQQQLQLEGTLLHRCQDTTNSSNKRIGMNMLNNTKKRNMKLYTIFDMSGISGGANLNVGGMGSLKCYRFVAEDRDDNYETTLRKKTAVSLLCNKSPASLPSKKDNDEETHTATKFSSQNHGAEDGGRSSSANSIAADNRGTMKKRVVINNQEANLILDIPGYLPWIVIDIENDPTAFVVEISTDGFKFRPDVVDIDDCYDDNDDGRFIGGGGNSADAASGKLNTGDDDESERGNHNVIEDVIKEEEEEQSDNDDRENDDGVFVFWGEEDDDNDDDDEGEDEEDKQKQRRTSTSAAIAQSSNQVQIDLARAVSKNKTCVRYAFKCPSSRKNEKALWLAAFSKVGRLSDESKRKKTLFGSSSAAAMNISATMMVPTAAAQKKKNSRMRKASSPNKAADLAKLSSLGNSMASAATSAAGGGGPAMTTVDDESSLLLSQKEYRVRPNYAYQHRWMTHAELKDEMMAPSTVMHDTRLSPTVITTNSRRELGLMRVEILQCRGLPQAKGKGNPNCVVYLVCGSYAFATDVIPQKKNPMWLRGMRRACALPVFHGYAVLMVGVFHDDGKGSKDTFFGRVEVPISRLRSNNTYDVTLPLRQSTSVYNRDKLGAVRLRFSLEYYDEKQVILSYAPSMRNKIGNRVCTTVACADPKSFRNVALTVHGKHLPDRFSTDMLKAAIRELTFIQVVTLRYGKQYIRDLICWRYPIFSAYSFGGWMHCVYSNSVVFVPVYFVGFALLHLASSYSSYISNERKEVRPLSWEELFISLQKKRSQSKKSGAGDGAVLLPLGFNGSEESTVSTEFPLSSFTDYSRFSVDESLNTSKEDGLYDDDVDDVDDDLSSSGSIGEFEKTLPEQNVSVKQGKKKKDKSIKQELEEVEEKVQKALRYVFQYHTYCLTESNESPFGKKATSEKGDDVYDSKRDLDKLLGVGQFSQWNPILSKVTCQLIPITRIFGVILMLYRSFYNIVTWRDPILTFWISIAGMTSLAVLLVFPWRQAFFLVGLFVLGPQNFVYRIVRQHFLYKTKNKRPGRFARAIREILKDDDGNSGVWAKNGREKVQSTGNAMSQPLFRCHAPVNNPLVKRTNNVGAQYVAVPYSAVYFNRFFDWPPDPDHTRVFRGSSSFSASLCPSSANDVVLAPKLLAQTRAKKAETIPSTDLSKNIPHNRETQTKDTKALSTPTKQQHTQKEVESSIDRTQSVNMKKLSAVAKTMGNRVASRMSAKLQPTLSKYKQVSKLSSFETSTRKVTNSVQNIHTKAVDDDTVDDGIPSVIETVTTHNTSAKNDQDSQQNSEIESSIKESNDDQQWNDSGQAVDLESEMHIGEEEKGELLSKIDENQDGGLTFTLQEHVPSNLRSHDSSEDEASVGSANDIPSPSGVPSSDPNDSDSDGEIDVLRSSPSSDSTSLLQQLLSIKLELATVRTENDNYRKKLKETEEERDMYKEKMEVLQSRVGFLANAPLLHTKGKSTSISEAFQLFGKKKNQADGT